MEQTVPKRSLGQRITVVLLIVFLVSPAAALAAAWFRVGVNLVRDRYEGIEFREIVSALADRDVRRLKSICVNDNYEFRCDLVKASKGIGGWKYALVDYYGLVQRIAGKNFVPGASFSTGVYRLDNGYLTTLFPVQENVPELAGRFLELDRFLKERGIDLLYVQAPGKVCKENPRLPRGAPADGSNLNADRFLELIEGGGADTLDLRAELHRTGMDHYSSFFRTDHHWTAETGFWGFRTIAGLLCSRYRFEIDPAVTDPANYEFRVYPEMFLGAWGKRTGSLYTTLDNITAIKPRFETSLTSTLANGQEVTGSLEDVLLVKFFLGRMNRHLVDPYRYYTGGDRPFRVIDNHMAPNNRKVFLVHDSFGRTVIPFLALCCERLVTADLRKSADFSLAEAIEREKPDIVVFLYCPFSLTDKVMDDFAGGTFRFGF